MEKELRNGAINYSPKGKYFNGLFYLDHSCDEWIIGDLAEAEKFAADLLKTIEECKKFNKQ